MMPMRILEGFANQLGKLRAEASLRRVTEIGVGSGTLKQRDEILREWRTAAGGARRLSSVGEVAAAAASIGFTVVRDIPRDS